MKFSFQAHVKMLDESTESQVLEQAEGYLGDGVCVTSCRIGEWCQSWSLVSGATLGWTATVTVETAPNGVEQVNA